MPNRNRKPVITKPERPAVPLTEEALGEIARVNPTGAGEHPIIQQLLAQRGVAA